MKILDHSYTTPEENLACDEALLDESEASGGDEVLRFWTSPTYFTVLGYSNIWKDEVKKTPGVPVFRRCSGGGSVLQGPGCLNYSLILKAAAAGPLANIRSTNEYVMQRQQKALSKLLGKNVLIQGHTDLTLDALKFSGNSQRRKKSRLLFHGTFLLDFDLERIARCLKFPPKQPSYRKDRPHTDFLTNLGVSEAKIKSSLREEWKAKSLLKEIPQGRIANLVEERYSKADWNFKF